jgi:hypothetical protein
VDGNFGPNKRSDVCRVMSPETLTTAPAGRVKLGNIHVLIDGKPFEIKNMNIVDVLVAGAPDWIAPRQKVDFSFVITMDENHPRPLPTYGVVVRNDQNGLEIRYNAPALRWRDILAHLIADDIRHPHKPVVVTAAVQKR